MAYNSELLKFEIDGSFEIQLTHPGDSTDLAYFSDSIKGDGFYGRSDGLHTAQLNLIGFLGKIVFQGTLATSPTETDWFDITETTHTVTSTDDSNSSGSFIYNFTGNFVFIRAYVNNWTDGTVKSIIVNN